MLLKFPVLCAGDAPALPSHWLLWRAGPQSRPQCHHCNKNKHVTVTLWLCLANRSGRSGLGNRSTWSWKERTLRTWHTFQYIICGCNLKLQCWLLVSHVIQNSVSWVKILVDVFRSDILAFHAVTPDSFFFCFFLYCLIFELSLFQQNTCTHKWTLVRVLHAI